MCFFQEANIFEGKYKKPVEFCSANIEAKWNTSEKGFWGIEVMHLPKSHTKTKQQQKPPHKILPASPAP